MALTVSYMGARGDHMPLGGTTDVALNVNQLDPKYMALGSQLNAALPESVLRQRRRRPALHPGDPDPRAAAAALSAVPQRQRPPGLRGHHPLQRGDRRMVSGGRAGATGTAAASATPTACSRTTSSARAISSRTPGPACRSTATATSRARPTTTREPTTPTASSTCRIASSSRPCSKCRSATAASGRRRTGCSTCVAGGWTAAAIVTVQSGFPIGVQQSDNTGTFGGAQRPNLVPGVDLRDARRSGRTGSPRPITPRRPGSTRRRSRPRPPTRSATPRGPSPTCAHRRSATSISRCRRTSASAGRSYAQVRVEVVNLLNRVTTSGIATTAGNASFGQISGQSGFMRLTQFSFRYSF